MSNIPTVQAMYAAFGAQDIPAILEHLSDDVQWDVWDPPSPIQDRAPYLAPRTGKAGVGEFFASLAALRLHRFEPLNLLEGGNQVVAVIAVDIEIASTGKRFGDLEVHLWTFAADGKVTGLRHILDTMKHAEALG